MLRASAVTLGSLLAGCTGDGGGEGESPTVRRTGTSRGTQATPNTPTATPTPTDTPTATQSPAPSSAQELYLTYQWSALEEARPTPTADITMRNTAFHPLIAAVAPGTEVTVTNEDPFPHTFSAPRLGVDERLDGGASVSFVVDRTGRYDYVCTLHPPAMLGRILVTPNPPTRTPTATDSPTPTPTRTPTAAPTDTRTATPTAPTTGTPGAVTIEGSEWELAPAAFTTPVDARRTIAFENVGSTGHNLAVGAFPVEERSAAEQAGNDQFMARTPTISPGETASVAVAPSTTGTFPYWCDVTGHRRAGMEGRMRVE
ncbi:MAG: cupredoxin domain-containing protein [Haloarculaceae archaeon]